jgi:hypothetical protein
MIFRARLMRVTYTWRNVSFRQDVALNFDRTSFHFYFESRVNMTGQIAHLIAATVFNPRALSLTFAWNKPRTIGALAKVSLKLEYGKTIPSLVGRW